MPATKIATCCYCGNRTVLQLRGTIRHELACASCAAPLHDLKMFPVVPDRATAPAATPARPARSHAQSRKGRSSRPARRRNIGHLARRIWAELWEEFEDIFD